VEFLHKESAERALSLNGTSFMTRILKVGCFFIYYLSYVIIDFPGQYVLVLSDAWAED
jgi:hypothetical protein